LSADLLELAASLLGDLTGELVFVGGASIHLWLSDPAAPAVRSTDDVDAIEGQDLAHPARFGLGDEIGLGKVKAIVLVDLERTQQHLRIDRHDARQRQRGPHQLGNARGRDLVERLEHIAALGENQVGEQQRPCACESGRRARCLLRRIAREVADQDIRV
jgi:hypothetical protein